jgi:hypothetical protein
MLVRGVRAYKHLKVEVGWIKIIDGRVCAIGPPTRQLVCLIGGIL